jgi:Protein of unknown function (DUF3089)
MRRSLCLALALAPLALPPAVRAIDVPVAGTRLVLGSRSLRATSQDTAATLGGGPGSADDPMQHGGRLRLTSGDGGPFDVAHVLPARGWRALRKRGQVVGWAYKGRGVVRSVTVRAGKGVTVRAKGRKLGIDLGADPDPVSVVLELGGQVHCMTFGGTTTFHAKRRFTARSAAAPPLCPLDYGDDARWLCRPGMAADQCFVNSLDATEVATDGSTQPAPRPGTPVDRGLDCFYVYPTVDLTGPVGNHTDVADFTLALDPLLSQAAPFRTLCRMFAPLYRQISLGTFGAPDADTYLDRAYADVRRAFRRYLDEESGGRPFVVMGHSQGTFMATRLLQELVDPSPELRARLVAAVLIGGSVAVPEGGVVGGTFQNLPLCQTAQQTGCVLAYRTYAEGHAPTAGSNVVDETGLDTACTNPAALGGGEGRLAASWFPATSRQPLFQVTPDPGYGTPFILYADFYAAECVKDDQGKSYLEIRARPLGGDVRTNPVPFDHPLFDPGFLGTHVLDYNFALGDLLALVEAKAVAAGVGP